MSAQLRVVSEKQASGIEKVTLGCHSILAKYMSIVMRRCCLEVELSPVEAASVLTRQLIAASINAMLVSSVIKPNDPSLNKELNEITDETHIMIADRVGEIVKRLRKAQSESN